MAIAIYFLGAVLGLGNSDILNRGNVLARLACLPCLRRFLKSCKRVSIRKHQLIQHPSATTVCQAVQMGQERYYRALCYSRSSLLNPSLALTKLALDAPAYKGQSRGKACDALSMVQVFVYIYIYICPRSMDHLHDRSANSTGHGPSQQKLNRP